MMTPISFDLVALLQEKTVATAESCTGGGVGAAITAIPGSSKIYKGGVVTYTNEVKAKLLNVDLSLLEQYGAVSAPVAKAMASNVRELLCADIGVSTTGLAGPDGDERGNPVGTVYIAYADGQKCICREFHFSGDRESVRKQAVSEAIKLIAANQ